MYLKGGERKVRSEIGKVKKFKKDQSGRENRRYSPFDNIWYYKSMFLQLLRELSPMPFEKFMELALYHPDYGYYARGNVPGKGGDYITSPCIHRAFGATLALQVLEVYEYLGKPEDFTVVEAGAGAGYLALDLISYLEDKGYSFKYVIIEPFPSLRAIQEENLLNFLDRVVWLSSFEELSSFDGVFIANELFDALPVHLIERWESELYEVWVEFGEGEVRETLKELSDVELLSRVYPFFRFWEDGYRTEVCLRAEEIYKVLAKTLKRGLILIIDYGYPRADYYHPERKRGTLLCYYRHRVVVNPYFKPGHIDITSHVDFTYLAELGEKYGFMNLGFTQQGSYLASLGIDKVIEEVSVGTMRDKEAIKMLLFPEGLGQTHWVLAQGRFWGNKSQVKLRGFRFSNRLSLLRI